MNKYIKNNDTVSHTWSGQAIAAGQYYMIEEFEESKWMSDSQLLSDIGSGIAIVAKDDSGSNDITDVSAAIDHLKGFNQVQKTQNILTQDGLTRRPKGFRFTATKNSTTEHHFLIDEALSIRGGSLEVQDHVFGDYFSFDIVDKDGIVYPVGTVVSDFIDKMNIRKSGLNEMVDESISGTIPANVFYFRLTYTSTGGTNDVKGALDVLAYV